MKKLVSVLLVFVMVLSGSTCLCGSRGKSNTCSK